MECPTESRYLIKAVDGQEVLRRIINFGAIDFGMATAIPPQPWLRDFVIGLGVSDAHRIVQSYITGVSCALVSNCSGLSK